jgi:pantoate--beta-alanine ligase
MIARRLLEITQLNVHLIICPTEREADGLAKSSRNQRLDPEARAMANTIYACLKYIKENQHAESFRQLQKNCLAKLEDAGFQTEYLELAEANTLELMQDFDEQKNMVVLIAAKIDDIRLIDNLRL